MSHKGLRVLLLFHGVVTLSAAIVLAVRPGLIPAFIGVVLDPRANIVAWLLAGAEFGLSALSFAGSRLMEVKGLRVIAWSCIVFHGSSALLEAYAYTQGLGAVILLNIAVRAVVIALFVWLSR